MTPEERQRLFAKYSEPKGKHSMEFTMKRGEENLEPGQSFSAEAMDEFGSQIMLFIGGRIMARWKQTDEPPTITKVTVKVDVG